MKNCLLVFIAGVHGTGKGHFCERLLRTVQWQYLSASSLLKWSEYTDDPLDKAVKSIPETQERLLKGLEKACVAGGRYLLDGHLTLLDEAGTVTRIDRKVFEHIDPKAIILKTEIAEVVQERLQQRDGKTYSLTLIEHMLREESNYSVELAEHLKVPHLEINPTNEVEMLSVVSNLAEQLARSGPGVR